MFDQSTFGAVPTVSTLPKPSLSEPSILQTLATAATLVMETEMMLASATRMLGDVRTELLADAPSSATTRLV
jgi:hypothetical protein